MPALLVPDLDALRLALTSAVISPELASTPVRSVIDADGRLWIEPSVELARPVIVALERLGIRLFGSSPPREHQWHAWGQLLPLEPAPHRSGPHLVELFDHADLPAVLRDVGMTARWALVDGRVLLLAHDLPVAARLRAEPGRLHVYARCGLSWVALGYRHPAGERIVAPVGGGWLIDPPQSWRFQATLSWDESAAPWEFREPASVADRAVSWLLPVPLRLRPSSLDEPARLWVIAGDVVTQLRRLASEIDDGSASRLELAIAERGGQRFAVLAARQGVPPVLVLPGAVAYQPALKMAGLFLPIGHQIKPKLRRDVVRRALATDAESVVWLEPLGEQFVAHRLAATAFHPMPRWLRYHVPAHDLVSPVLLGNPFALLPYDHREEAEPPPPPAISSPVPTSRPASSAPLPLANAPRKPGIWQRLARLLQRAERPVVPPEVEPAPRVEETPDERRVALEQQIAASPAADTTKLWPELATLQSRAGQASDAALAWLAALWEEPEPPTLWASGWARAEAKLLGRALSEEEWPRFLSEHPPANAARLVAATLAWAASKPQPPELASALPHLSKLLHDAEPLMPVRVAWMGRIALSKLSRGDVLGLAACRDRLLSRLLIDGLSLERDVPAFLRYAGPGAERARQACDWLMRAREPTHRWIRLPANGRPVVALDPHDHRYGLVAETRHTPHYADLMFAWGLARLGERGSVQKLLDSARSELTGIDAAHTFLVDAFSHRIGQAAMGQAGRGPLPAPLLSRLAELEGRETAGSHARDQQLLYVIERLRERSGILEPAEVIEGARAELKRSEPDATRRQLESLLDERSPQQLAERIESLWTTAITPVAQARLLSHALAVAPRGGDNLGRTLVGRAVAVVPRAPTAERLGLLERALFVAAYVGDVGLFASLADMAAKFDVGEHAGDALAGVWGQAVRGWRRLGRAEEGRTFADRAATKLVGGADLAGQLNRLRGDASLPMLQTLLALAEGWGATPATETVLDAARTVLFALPEGNHQIAPLACQYIAALGQSTPVRALSRLDELFAKLNGVPDKGRTGTHYALNHLRLIDAAVRAVAGDDFALGPALKQRLDDDEFAIRQRIHRDMRAALG